MIKQLLTAAAGLSLVITAHAQLWDGGDADDIGFIGPNGGCAPTGSPSKTTSQIEALAAMRVSNSVFVYAGGCFETMGGVPDTSGVAAWDTLNHVWSALPFTGFNGKIKDMLTWDLASNQQILVIAGEFDFTSNSSSGEDLAFYDGSNIFSLSTFTANSGNPNGPVTTLAISPGKDLCMAGAFDTIGGITIGNNQRFVACINDAASPPARSVRKWGNGTYSGLNGTIKDIAFAPNGNLIYAVGDFDFAPRNTVCPSQATVRGVARLRINSNRWHSLACGLIDGVNANTITYHQQHAWVGGVQQLRGINGNGTPTPIQFTPILKWSALPNPNGSKTWDFGPFFGITDPTVLEFYRHQGQLSIGGTYDSTSPVRVGKAGATTLTSLANNDIPNGAVKAILETKYNGGNCSSTFVAGHFVVQNAPPGNMITEAMLPGGKCDPPPPTAACDLSLKKEYVGLNAQGAHEYRITITNESKCVFDGYLHVTDEADGNLSMPGPAGPNPACDIINDLKVDCSVAVNDFGPGDVYHFHPTVFAFGPPPGSPPDNCASLELLSFDQDNAGAQIVVQDADDSNNSACFRNGNSASRQSNNKQNLPNLPGPNLPIDYPPDFSDSDTACFRKVIDSGEIMHTGPLQGGGIPGPGPMPPPGLCLDESPGAMTWKIYSSESYFEDESSDNGHHIYFWCHSACSSLPFMQQTALSSGPDFCLRTYNQNNFVAVDPYNNDAVKAISIHCGINFLSAFKFYKNGTPSTNIESGDVVQIQAKTGSFLVRTFQGELDGNGNKSNPGTMFRVNRIKDGGPGSPTAWLQNGDVVTLQSVSHKKFIAAEDGGDGQVNADRDDAITWEQFSLVLPK